jgi:hypothetical protein
MVIDNLYLKIGLVLMGLGGFSFFTGLVILLTRVLGGGINKIAKETQKIVQKGIAEEVAGLVGNASVLIESLNELVQTAAGIGVFLIIIGVLMMGGSLYLILQLA